MAKQNTEVLVQVNYDLRLEAAIKAGKYNWTNSDINDKNFPSKRSGMAELDIRLVHFNKNMASEDVLKELDKMNLRPIELPELLAFGAMYPDEQKKYPIVALGSVCQGWFGDQSVPGLWDGGDGRGLSLCLGWLDGGWGEGYRFAAVSK